MPFLERRSDAVNSGTPANGKTELDNATPWIRDEYVPGSSSRDATFRLPQRDIPRQACGNAECSGRWTMPWKNRRRPIFEGQWGCGTRCLDTIIRGALRRERGDLRPAMSEAVPHRHRVPLGLVLLDQGWITQAQLRCALQAQRDAGTGRIGDWLVQEAGVHPAHITRGLAIQWSCPVLPMDGFAPSVMALAVPRLFVEELGLLPLRVVASRLLYLAFSDRLDASAARAVEQMSGLRVESGLLNDVHFDAARARLFESTFVEARQESFVDNDSLSAKIAAILEQSQTVGSRLVRLHQHYWLRTWLEAGAYSGAGTLPSTGEDVIDTIFTLESRGT